MVVMCTVYRSQGSTQGIYRVVYRESRSCHVIVKVLILNYRLVEIYVASIHSLNLRKYIVNRILLQLEGGKTLQEKRRCKYCEV